MAANGISGKDKVHICVDAGFSIVTGNAPLYSALRFPGVSRIPEHYPTSIIVLESQVTDKDIFNVLTSENRDLRSSQVLSVNDTFFGGGGAFKYHSGSEFQREDFAFTWGFRRIRIVGARLDVHMPRGRQIVSLANQQGKGNRLIRLCGRAVCCLVVAVDCVHIDVGEGLRMTYAVEGECEYDSDKD